VISTAPRASLLTRAAELDAERAAGKIRGPLHGIPILVKDNVATHPDLGMDTTAGSLALAGSRPKRNADIVDSLLEAGAIILGKANLSELSNFKGKNLYSGWSAVGGQTQSAYVPGGIKPDEPPHTHSGPSGSSTGSAQAVAAGFAPVSIGTETDASLHSPSGLAALYTIKPTIGLASTRGIVPISDFSDAPGPMTKCVEDLAVLLDVLVDSKLTNIPPGGYTTALNKSWADLRVGVLSPSDWEDKFEVKDSPDSKLVAKQEEEETTKAYETIKSHAKEFHSGIDLISIDELTVDPSRPGTALWDLFVGDFKKNMDAYLSDLETSSVRTLEDIVGFNKKNADRELPPKNPNQETCETALKNIFDSSQRQKHLEIIRSVGRDRGIDATLSKYNIDVIIGPNEGEWTSLAACAGYPLATLPLGYLDYNGRPFALLAVAKAHQEATLIKVMSAWEATFPARKPPPLEIVGEEEL